jgi:hypothetical protein
MSLIKAVEKRRNQLDITMAIIRRRCIVIDYRDEGERVVQPHCIFTSAKGEVCLDAFQVSGASSSETTEGWKIFKVDNITDMLVKDDIFVTHDQFNRDSQRYKNSIQMVQ